MHQVAEFRAAERVITQILDHSACVGLGMRLLDLIVRQPWVSLEQQRAALVGPEQVHHLLVGQNRVRERTVASHDQDEKKCHYTPGQQASTAGSGTERWG